MYFKTDEVKRKWSQNQISNPILITSVAAKVKQQPWVNDRDKIKKSHRFLLVLLLNLQVHIRHPIFTLGVTTVAKL